jgi:hypothetical protein
MYAETILEQLGGRQFLLLTGSKNLVKDDIKKFNYEINF